MVNIRKEIFFQVCGQLSDTLIEDSEREVIVLNHCHSHNISALRKVGDGRKKLTWAHVLTIMAGFDWLLIIIFPGGICGMSRNFYKLVIFFILAAMVTGCAKSPSRPLMQGYQSINVNPPKDGYDRLIICRPWKFVSGGVYSAFLINDIPAANFRSGSAAFDVKPGQHKITAKITDYDGSDWGKGIVVKTQQNVPTIVKFNTGNRKFSLEPGLPVHDFTYYQPENGTIKTNYQSKEEINIAAETKKKKAKKLAGIETYKKNINTYITKKNYQGLKSYINKNPRAAHYIPDYKLRLLFIGPENLQVGDIIKYKKKRMSDVLLAAKIKSSKTPYKQFSMEEIEMLQHYNISDSLIAAMIEVTTEIEKEMARDEKQREYLNAQRTFAKQQEAGVTGNSPNQTIAGELGREVGKEIGKQVIKGLIKNLF